ncbi:MAG: putative quinol monooxygenase [Acidobacteriota bacterium]
MSDEKVIILGMAEVKPEHIEDFKKVGLELVAASRTEAACISYDCHQSKESPNKFMFYEVWANQDGIDTHFKMPHTQELFGKAQTFLVNPPSITFWTKLS